MRSRFVGVYFVGSTISRVFSQEWIDRVDDFLTRSSSSYGLRGRLSGTLDLEGYAFEKASLGSMEAGGHTLFNPRLSLFVDGQWGDHVYSFVQARVDRGFDPADREVQARADEYAVRVSPWSDRELSFQVGKFATVIGSWAPRHLSWDNPFITSPLVYSHPTHVSDVEAPDSAADFVGPPDEAGYRYNPVIWGPSYSSGMLLSGGLGDVEVAVAMKNAPPASRPESWSALDVGFEHPSFEGRITYQPGPQWKFGFSASEGPYYRTEALEDLPAGKGLGDYREQLMGQDLAFAWHHVQLWAEVYEARFSVPRVGDADTLGWYLEAKYKLTAQWFTALRWNQQWFSDVPNGAGGQSPWGADVWRMDTAIGYRLTDHAQIKLQYEFLGNRERGSEGSSLAAVQFTARF